MTADAAYALLVTFVIVVAGVCLIPLLIERFSSRGPNRDETLRAGSPAQLDSHAAALRAGGRTAWMRPGGGGGGGF